MNTNFKSDGLYSGYLSIDSKNRLYPQMPNDTLAFQTPIVGIWFYGVSDFRTSYVWAACARLIFCRNFKENGKFPLNSEADSFIVVGFA
jgi:hypothetical protein